MILLPSTMATHAGVGIDPLGARTCISSTRPMIPDSLPRSGISARSSATPRWSANGGPCKGLALSEAIWRCRPANSAVGQIHTTGTVFTVALPVISIDPRTDASCLTSTSSGTTPMR